MKSVPENIDAFLRFDNVIALNDAIKALTDKIIAEVTNETENAKTIFEWVRDNIPHTKDIGGEVVTCTSIEAFGKRTGICFAKAHLLAAMLRYVGIPTGFCYLCRTLEQSSEGTPKCPKHHLVVAQFANSNKSVNQLES